MLLENSSPFQLSSSVIESNQNAAYFATASLAVLVYDYLLTLNLEISLIWGTPWNVGKILFLLTRYPVFVDASLLAYFHLSGGGLTSVTTCRAVYQVSGWLIFAGTVTAEFVLIFRTWAIWGQSRRIAIGLVGLMVILAIPVVYLTYVGEGSVEFVQSPAFLMQRCLIAKIHHRTILSDYIVIVALETVILGLTLVKGVQNSLIKGVRNYKNSNSSLMTTLYKDGILYYVYLTAISLANACVYALPDQTHGASLILTQRVFHSIFTARILLHLRLAILRDRKTAVALSGPAAMPTLIAPSQRAEISTIIFGAEIWYHSHDHNGENTFSDPGDEVV